MNIDSIIFGIEYLFRSAMEYLSATYMDKPTCLRDMQVSADMQMAIQEGASAASYAADSYEGAIDGRTVI